VRKEAKEGYAEWTTYICSHFAGILNKMIMWW